MGKSILLLLGLAGVVLFSGCARTVVIISPEPIKVEQGHEIVVGVDNHSDSNTMGAVHVKRNNNSKFLIQSNADITIRKGAKYFRIIDPIDSSAEMLSSPEEIENRCYNNYATSTFIGANWCYKKIDGAYSNKIAYYTEKPNDFLVFDAEEVLNYMRDNGTIVDLEEVDLFKYNGLDSSFGFGATN